MANHNIKTVHWGVSVQVNQDRVYFYHLYFFPQKNSLFTSDIHNLLKGIDLEDIIL